MIKMEFIDDNHIKEEMSDEEFKNCISEITKTRNEHNKSDGHITVCTLVNWYKNIPYLIKIQRYYQIGVKLKKINGPNRINKWVVLECPKTTIEFVNEMEEKYNMINDSSFDFLHGNTRHANQKDWTLKEMINQMHIKAKRDIRRLLYYKDLNLTWKTFKINKFIKLRFIRDKTLIYVNDKQFDQCKYLLLNIPVDKIPEYDNIESIDEASEVLDKSMEYNLIRISQIPPEDEFWGHCSNLQVWAENNYDTRLIHRNLAFPLLKKLTEIGDPIAKRVFKDEIARRLENGNKNVIQYLINGDYINYLTEDELNSLSLSTHCKYLIKTQRKFYKFIADQFGNRHPIPHHEPIDVDSLRLDIPENRDELEFTAYMQSLQNMRREERREYYSRLSNGILFATCFLIELILIIILL